MLENIALIASAISGLTAVTTSLRALGKSREILRDDMKSGITSGCRTGSGKTTKQPHKQRSILIYLIVTGIWFALSVIFRLPVLIQQWEDTTDVQFLIWSCPFVLLSAILIVIWWKVLHPGNK